MNTTQTPESEMADRSTLSRSHALTPLPTPSLEACYPPHQIDQPLGSVPVLNHNGVIIGWTAKDLKVSGPIGSFGAVDGARLPKFPDAVAYQARDGSILCWLDYWALVPGATDDSPVRGNPHHIPVLNRRGKILGWAPEPDGSKRNRPSPSCVPLMQHNVEVQFAWLEEIE